MFGKRKIKLVTIVATVILAVAIMAVVPITKAGASTETTGTPSQTLLSATSPWTPVPNTSYFDQSVYNVQTGGNNFDVYVMWSGSESPPCYFWGGQFDLTYNDSLITLLSYSNGVIEGLTASYAGTANGTHGGSRYFFLTEDWDTYIWNENSGNGINGSGYWVKLTFITNTINTGTTGLNFSAARTALEAIGMWDNYYEAGYIENAMWINSTVNVNPGVTPEPTLSPTVSPTISPTMSPTPTATPSPTPTTRVYNFVGVKRATNNHFAYYCDEDDNLPPPAMDEMTEATNKQYSQIKSSDNLRQDSPNPGKGDYPFMKFDMNIKENPTDVSRIDLSFEGFALRLANSTFQIWAYNYNSSSWSQLGASQELKWGLDGMMIRSITSNCRDYISQGGMLTWGVFVDETNVKIATDYVEAKVTAIGP